jgi:hypothetical protein
MKVVGDVDEAVADGDLAEPAKAQALLREASRNVETVETQARMLIGRYLDDDEKVAGLRARIRQELMAEMLDIVNAYVDPATYQSIRRRLIALS